MKELKYGSHDNLGYWYILLEENGASEEIMEFFAQTYQEMYPQPDNVLDILRDLLMEKGYQELVDQVDQKFIYHFEHRNNDYL